MADRRSARRWLWVLRPAEAAGGDASLLRPPRGARAGLGSVQGQARRYGPQSGGALGMSDGEVSYVKARAINAITKALNDCGSDEERRDLAGRLLFQSGYALARLVGNDRASQKAARLAHKLADRATAIRPTIPGRGL